MNSRTKFVEKKRFNITKQWEMRCQFSALNRELPEWKTILMEQIGITINLPQIISQYKKIWKRSMKKEDKIPKNTKKERFRRRLKNIQKKFQSQKKVQDVMNLNKKNEAFINLSVYINEFEKTFKKKKTSENKNINFKSR
ncbi:hypothetical protein M0813_26533 [Anaeramoeba flamelloides]|uniref:Uncharacterized protein n=1 Tax=Anaeramoeba flamelloides TaxID=1746091 RepID=A0ABQ8XYR1_9EUKA|nr:hypothetical protein M0813_26533 [Anaeramoeba flamelloides]